jgi:osmoprotectant transport system substrate-binding protein
VKRTPLGRTAASIAAGLAGVLLLAACGGGGGGGADPLSNAPADSAPADVIRVGSEQFPENQLLGEIYAQALEAKGVQVERQFAIGAREVYYPALLDGSIDVVPDYNGNLLRYVVPEATESSPEDVYAALERYFAAEEPRLRVLEQAEAENKDAFTVTRAFAEANNLTSIEDVVPLCPTIVFGGPAQFAERSYGLQGMRDNYGCEFAEFRPLDTGGPLTVAALADGTIQGADLFTTDPAIPNNDFVTLEDPRNNFPAQNVVPLINASKVTPAVEEALNGVSAALSLEDLVQLNVTLGEQTQSDADIARAWLTEKGLV